MVSTLDGGGGIIWLMNVLLLYPRFPDTFWSLRHALRFIRKQSAMPPLGLLTVAALLPPQWALRLVDTNVSDLTDADFDKLRDMGISDAEIVEIVALSGLGVYLNIVADALKIEVDDMIKQGLAA